MEIVVGILIVGSIVYLVWKSSNRSAPPVKTTTTAEVIDTRDNIDKELLYAKDIYLFEFLVRGGISALAIGEEEQEIFLLPQPSNNYDKNAILASNIDGVIGYIAKEENKWLSKHLIDDKKYFAKIRWTNEEGPKRYLIELYSYDFIKGSRNFIKKPVVKVSAELKQNIYESDREQFYNFLGAIQDDLDTAEDESSDDIDNIITDLIVCLEDKNVTNSSEALFDCLSDYLPEIDLMIKEKMLNSHNTKIARNLKKRMNEVFKNLTVQAVSKS